MTLSRAELELTRTDGALTGLQTILDPNAVLSQIVKDTNDSVAGKATRNYIRYKPGTNCLVAYVLEAEGRESSMYAKAYADNFEEKCRKAVHNESLSQNGAKRLWISHSEQLLIRRFPADGKLSSLERLVDQFSRRSFLRRLLPTRPEFWESTVTELAYKPERRFVCKLDGLSGHSSVLKLYCRSAFSRSIKNAKFLERIAYDRLPPRIGESEKHCSIAFDWYPGHSFRDIAGQHEDSDEYARMVGQELANLHKQNPGPELVCWKRDEEIATVKKLAQTLSILLPDATDLVEFITCRLADGLRKVSFQQQLIHGDFHSKQILLDSGAVRFLDLDELAAGPVEYDLGSFLAHVQRDALRGYLQPEIAARISRHFLRSYLAKSAAPDDIALFVALALFKYSHHPFRACEQNWELGVKKILRSSANIIDQLDADPMLTFTA